jgi:diphthamide synthase (EF-2-diphthine--ammonia ligase)
VQQLAGTGLEPLFPVWGIPTDQLAREMIAASVKAKITCIDPAKLERSFAGRDFDAALLGDLPPQIDPCGENGEFHSFCYESPVFRAPIAVDTGEIVERGGFVFADVLLVR